MSSKYSTRGKVLRPVFPNVGIEIAYKRKINDLVDLMQRSYVFFLKAQYRETPPALAQDATPAEELRRELRKLGVRWEKRFAEAAPKLAAYFAKTASRRSDAALLKILRDAGMTVKFRMTRAMRDVLDATLADNVALIKSIASEYHTQVSGLVMRSVSAGRDLGFLTRELERRHGITRRRAALIARTQNNLATATMTRVRQTEAGITEAIWLHSAAGKEPRRSHVAQSGKKYNIQAGFWDPDEKVWCWPGTLINCRCVSKSIIRGFS
jgi:uncharacterized protein with gpF-like domain